VASVVKATARLAGNASATAAKLAAQLQPHLLTLGNASRTSARVLHNASRTSARVLGNASRASARVLHNASRASARALSRLAARGSALLFEPGSLPRRGLLRLCQLAGGGARASWRRLTGDAATPEGAAAAAAAAASSPGAAPDAGRRREQLAQYTRVLGAGDHYDVLGLGAGSSVREVKAAFRRLSLLLHPDKIRALGRQSLPGSLEAAFQRLQAAHEVLVDEKQRALYDMQRHAGGGHPSYGAPHQPPRQAPTYDAFASMRFDFERGRAGRPGGYRPW